MAGGPTRPDRRHSRVLSRASLVVRSSNGPPKADSAFRSDPVLLVGHADPMLPNDWQPCRWCRAGPPLSARARHPANRLRPGPDGLRLPLHRWHVRTLRQRNFQGPLRKPSPQAVRQPARLVQTGLPLDLLVIRVARLPMPASGADVPVRAPPLVQSGSNAVRTVGSGSAAPAAAGGRRRSSPIS